jgi:uncharacterized membrane protein
MRAPSTIAALVVLVAVFGVLHVGFYDNPLFSGGPYQSYGNAVVQGQVPYRDFEVEYPPGALPAFVAPALLSPDPSQPTQYNRAFEGLMLLCAAAALIAMGFVRRGWPLFAFALAPLLLGSIVLHRYDFWPAALAVAALAAFERRHEPVAFALLATATAAKVWPAVLLPLFFVAARGRVRAAVVFAAVLAVWFVPFVAVAPSGVWHSVRSQATRPLQIESLGASALVVAGADVEPFGSHGSDNLRGQGTAAAATTLVVLKLATLTTVWIGFSLSRRRYLVRWSAAAVAAYVAFDKVLSPQFLIWLLPFVPLVRGRRGVVASTLLAAALVLTQIEFPYRYLAYATGLDHSIAVIVLARDVLLVAVLVVLGWRVAERPRARGWWPSRAACQPERERVRQ